MLSKKLCRRSRLKIFMAGLLIVAIPSVDLDFALMLSLPAALEIGLRLSNMVQVELADGSIKKEFMFEAKAVLEIIPVDVLLTSSDENLVGTALLQNRS